MNHYETLGVSKTATLDEINRSFRILAKQNHPDINPSDPSAVDRFKKMMEAYEVLTNPTSRARYDAVGYTGRRQTSAPKPTPKTKTKEEFEIEREEEKRREKANSDFWGYGKSPFTTEELEKVECTFFGNNSSGRNIMVQLKLTDEERQKGGKKTFCIKKRNMCNRCLSDGAIDVICPKCQNISLQRMACQTCEFTGQISKTCQACKGEGLGHYVIQSQVVAFPPNTQPGYTVNIHGEGEMSANQKPPGYIRVILI